MIWFSISVMELLISWLTAARELTESLIWDTWAWLSSFRAHTFLILSDMEVRELMVPLALSMLF